VTFAGVALISACSGGREQRAPERDRIAQPTDLTLPDTLSREDTSVTTTASRAADQPVSPVEQHATPAPSPARVKSAPAGRRARPATAAAEQRPADTTVHAYAPDLSRDTATTSRDTSAPASEPDTVASADSGKTLDSTSLATADTARPRADSAASPPRDTARSDSAARSAVSAPPYSAPTDPASRTLPVGTEIHAALDDSITSRRDTVGQLVSGHVMENVMGRDGRTLIAAGTPVRFTITQIRPSRSKGSQGRLALRPEALSLGGHTQPVNAEIRNVPRELRGRGVTTSEAAKVGGGAAAGAVIGGVVGKTKGAVIGGVAGAAAGAVVASQTATRDVVVKAKTPVVLVLTAPLVAP